MRSWNSIASLIPKGGDPLWSDGVEDFKGPDGDAKYLIQLKSFSVCIFYIIYLDGLNLTAEQSLDFMWKEMELTDVTSKVIASRLKQEYSFGVARNEKGIKY